MSTWAIHCRATDVTIGTVSPPAGLEGASQIPGTGQPGDKFWSRGNIAPLPSQNTFLTTHSAGVVNRPDSYFIDRFYSGIALDAEYKGSGGGLDPAQCRTDMTILWNWLMVDSGGGFNGRNPSNAMSFDVFFNPSMINPNKLNYLNQPGDPTLMTIANNAITSVCTGASFWKGDYVNWMKGVSSSGSLPAYDYDASMTTNAPLITKSVLLGPSNTDPEWTVAEIETSVHQCIDAPTAGLGYTVFQYYYPGDSAGNLIIALADLRSRTVETLPMRLPAPARSAAPARTAVPARTAAPGRNATT